MLTCRAWQLPAGIAATVATVSAACGAKGAAVLAGGCLTVLVVGDVDVLAVEEPHPASATPTTAMIGRAARPLTFRLLGLNAMANRSRTERRVATTAAFVQGSASGDEALLVGHGDRLTALSISSRYRVRRSVVVVQRAGCPPWHALSFCTCRPSHGRVAYTPVNRAHPPTLWQGCS